MENEELNQFIEFRNELIETLGKKEITKLEFIIKNYEYLSRFELSPYDEITNIYKGVLAYQYFNSYAKYFLTEAFEIEFRDPQKAYKLREKGFENYSYKDNIIKEILTLINYKNVEAFYINMDSKSLEGELFEIVLKDYDKVIFHTKDKLILNRLRKNGVFSDEIQDSVIASYVNKKY